MRIAMLTVLVLLLTATLTRAADEHPSPVSSESHAVANEPTYTHPQLPPHPASWAGVVVIVILGMFLAAATIGPIVRAHMPEEVPDTDSHDEHGHGQHDAAHGHGHVHH